MISAAGRLSLRGGFGFKSLDFKLIDRGHLTVPVQMQPEYDRKHNHRDRCAYYVNLV